MDLSVVVTAEQHAVVEAGRAAVCPVDDVVAVAPRGWPGAAREGAPAISEDQRAAQGGGEQPVGATDVKGMTGAVAQDRRHNIVVTTASQANRRTALADIV